MTLNQIVKAIETLGNNHEQINTTFFGDTMLAISEGEVVYPAFIFNLTGANILQKQIQYNFSLYFMDRELNDLSNETEVLSDMTLVCEDIIAELRSPTAEFTMGDNATITYFAENDPDFLAGLRVDVTLTLPSINNRCQIPNNG